MSRGTSDTGNIVEDLKELSLEQVLEENSVFTYTSDPTNGHDKPIRPKLIKPYLHFSKKKSVSPPDYETRALPTSLSKPVLLATRSKSIPSTPSSPSSHTKKYKQPRKAWEWHFRSFLSHDKQSVGKKLSRIIHTINPVHLSRATSQEVDELENSDRSLSNSGTMKKKLRNKFKKSCSSNDLSYIVDELQTSRGMRNRRHEDTTHDASMRKTFTTYHNSRDFGKDTTSAYLGTSEDDLSGHYHEQQFYNFYYKLNSFAPPTTNARRSAYHSPSSFLFASSEPLDTLVEGESPDCITVIEDDIPLFPLVGFEAWNKHDLNDNSEKLILPAVLRMCPVSVVTHLLSETKSPLNSLIKNKSTRSGLAQMLEPLSDDDEVESQQANFPISTFSSTHVKLGTAKVTILKNFSIEDHYNKNHIQSTFYIATNYLYEYGGKKNLLPRSITHLPNAVIKKHDTFSNSFELLIIQNGKSKDLVITLQNVMERDEWVEKLTRASKLDIHDIYDYDMNNKLGTGRYATIVPATHKNSHVKNAIKIIDKSQFFERVSRSKERIDTLVREISIQATLSLQENNNFLQLKNVFETSTKLVLELELLNGMDLFTYVSTHGVLEETKAAWIIRDLLICCVGMKRRGIAHRDIKPANILVCDDLLEDKTSSISVKLGDYGMSTFCGIDDLCHGRCGTPGYVAPEILKAGVNGRYKNSVDVFSVGVTLYVLLCGYEPFYGENDGELISVNRDGYFDFPEDDWSTVSEEAKDLITQMMEKDPMKRITADLALKHPWIRKYAPSYDMTKMNTNTCTIC